ncbi:hypothetical protein EZS27_014193 [termite gut metagenome]|uniref:Uncharacterized protein n=1 Tax=termite gut metagenome TaxID=433724 RepID=A0A5J4RX68_9ZZZZ
MGKFSIFAMFKIKNILHTIDKRNLFVASYKGIRPSKSPLPLILYKGVLDRIREADGLLILLTSIFINEMVKNNENASSVKHSSAQARPTYENGFCPLTFFSPLS